MFTYVEIVANATLVDAAVDLLPKLNKLKELKMLEHLKKVIKLKELSKLKKLEKFLEIEKLIKLYDCFELTNHVSTHELVEFFNVNERIMKTTAEKYNKVNDLLEIAKYHRMLINNLDMINNLETTSFKSNKKLKYYYMQLGVCYNALKICILHTKQFIADMCDE